MKDGLATEGNVQVGSAFFFAGYLSCNLNLLYCIFIHIFPCNTLKPYSRTVKQKNPRSYLYGNISISVDGINIGSTALTLELKNVTSSYRDIYLRVISQSLWFDCCMECTINSTIGLSCTTDTYYILLHQHF